MSNTITKEQGEKVFLEHADYVYKVALFLTGSKELADDITQETFIRVFQKYLIFDSAKAMRPWIHKITVNVTRNMLRRQKWLKFMGKLPENNFVEQVENTVLKDEEEQRLWREINRLSFKSREMIILHFYSGMKLHEISEALGIPLGTCKSRLHTALTTLRRQLPQNDFNYLNRGGDSCGTI